MPNITPSISSNDWVASPFDTVAPTYQEVVNHGLSITGEDLNFFARERVRFLESCLDFCPEVVLDFGCGTGTTTPLFLEILGAKRTIGMDKSTGALAEARRKGFATSTFYPIGASVPKACADVAYANTVFHHIPVEERDASLRNIHETLRPNGILAFWENNPWNPGTRWVMSRIPFDADAILLHVFEAQKLIEKNGFQVLRTDFQFIFPGSLKVFRPLEKWVTKLPIGGQYQILAKKI